MPTPNGGSSALAAIESEVTAHRLLRVFPLQRIGLEHEVGVGAQVTTQSL